MKKKNFLTLLVVLGLLISLLSVARSSASPGSIFQAAATQAVPIPRITATLPPPTRTLYSVLTTPAGERPPACTFPLAQTAAEKSVPQEYIFSEPKIVYTPAPDDSYVEIVEWLPDNRRVLVVQNLDGSIRQKIELFDPETGERQVYAIRERPSNYPPIPPVWNQEIGAVVYPVEHVLKIVNHIPEIDRQVWVSYGNPESPQRIAKDLSQSAVAVEPGTGRIVYVSSGKVSKQTVLSQNATSIPFDLPRWNYRGVKTGVYPLMYVMAWRPGTSQVFLYSFAYGGKPGYTFLLDVNTGNICEFELDGWAVTARWSPNGRYLAINRSRATDTPFAPTDIAVIDSLTGKVYTSEVVSRDTPGIHTVGSIAWAPDNRHLLVLGEILSFPHCTPNCDNDIRLYLVDFISGQVVSILPEHQFISNFVTSLAWSPDGSKVIALCSPGIRCSISIQVNGH